jgi:hypothetical protein
VNPSDAERAAVRVGLSTLALGGALVVAPTQVGGRAGFRNARAARIAGLADLALVPGLLGGRPRWPWMAARVGLNLAMIGYLVGGGSAKAKSYLAAAGLLAATVTDLPALLALRSASQ